MMIRLRPIPSSARSTSIHPPRRLRPRRRRPPLRKILVLLLVHSSIE
ncbi:unnamed protein product [Cyprideis torosa]|uniref:Uncharacterized protein n=1 Tax=Cyprideis torosa TaxID=163714 RepID=A0A7R8ZTE4_9CRUS|nr:unnamed protein product [Cyprideis torosa]CAG0907451.1 unnamed protein product [Cyprideis torosa]